MIVLSVCNHKGGTGKTTTSIHIAAALGLSGWRTLVVDLDPQGFLTRAMGVGEPPPEESVAAFFEPDFDLENVRLRDASGFDLIPSSSSLTKRMRGLNKPTDVLWIREAFEASNPEYDVVIFDTAAALTVYSLNALVASEHVLIPVLPEYQAVVGSEQTYKTTELVRNKLNPRLESRMFLLTQVDGRKRMHHQYREYVREKYGSEVLDSIIRTCATLAESQEKGATVFSNDPSSRGALDYANAADELIRRIEGPTASPDSNQDSSTSDASAEEEPASQMVGS